MTKLVENIVNVLLKSEGNSNGSNHMKVYIDHKPYTKEVSLDLKNGTDASGVTLTREVEFRPQLLVKVESNKLITQYQLDKKTAKLSAANRSLTDEDLDAGAKALMQANEYFRLKEKVSGRMVTFDIEQPFEELEKEMLERMTFLRHMLAYGILTLEEVRNPILTGMRFIVRAEAIPEVNAVSLISGAYDLAYKVYHKDNNLPSEVLQFLDTQVGTGKTMRQALTDGYQTYNFVCNMELIEKYNILKINSYESPELSRIKHFTDFVPLAIKFSTVENIALSNAFSEQEQARVERASKGSETLIKPLRKSIKIENVDHRGNPMGKHGIEGKDAYTLFVTKKSIADSFNVYPVNYYAPAYSAMFSSVITDMHFNLTDSYVINPINEDMLPVSQKKEASISYREMTLIEILFFKVLKNFSDSTQALQNYRAVSGRVPVPQRVQWYI